MDFKKINKIHFVGIGGIGVSALARMMVHGGKKVTGSDVQDSRILDQLSDIGVKVFVGHDKKNLDSDTDLVIYSPAIPRDNIELAFAKKLDIPAITYPEALGYISNERYTIAVSGTHGKTTTTAMLASIFAEAELDPTVIVGSLLKSKGTNFVAGTGPHLILEACEYKRSFLSLDPNILVITNIDKDHLDYFKDIEDIQNAFISLVHKLDKDDYLICDMNHENLLSVVSEADCHVVDYTKYLDDQVKLPFPGEHNFKNAAAAFAVAHTVGIEKEVAYRALEHFSGTWRRFEYKGESVCGAEIYDDYAHNPEEITVTLRAVRKMFPKQRIFVVFQPHLYSRTKIFLKEFSESFNDVDEIVLAPIYAAREKQDQSINSWMLAKKIAKNDKKVSFFESFNDIATYLDKHTKNGDLIITMGAGDIFRVAEKLVNFSQK
jgi:UDP-N-acetylmuramate--alanine ligase